MTLIFLWIYFHFFKKSISTRSDSQTVFSFFGKKIWWVPNLNRQQNGIIHIEPIAGYFIAIFRIRMEIIMKRAAEFIHHVGILLDELQASNIDKRNKCFSTWNGEDMKIFGHSCHVESHTTHKLEQTLARWYSMCEVRNTHKILRFFLLLSQL